jgi:hypothetical protein
MTEEFGQALAASCPVHPDNARVRRVSVVYATEASQLLSPGPVLKAASRIAWAGTTCGIAGAVAIWIGAMLGRGASGPALIAALVCFAYALALYGWAGARRARLMAVERGMPGAMAVWRAAWYCDECDGIFFESGTGADAEAPEGRVISPAAFHRMVWKAGRFGGIPATWPASQAQ